jgi:hypothetical protein
MMMMMDVMCGVDTQLYTVDLTARRDSSVLGEKNSIFKLLTATMLLLLHHYGLSVRISVCMHAPVHGWEEGSEFVGRCGNANVHFVTICGMASAWRVLLACMLVN